MILAVGLNAEHKKAKGDSCAFTYKCFLINHVYNRQFTLEISPKFIKLK